MLLKLHFLFHGNNLQKQYTLEIMVQIIGYQQTRAHKLNIANHSLKTEFEQKSKSNLVSCTILPDEMLCQIVYDDHHDIVREHETIKPRTSQ